MVSVRGSRLIRIAFETYLIFYESHSRVQTYDVALIIIILIWQ